MSIQRLKHSIIEEWPVKQDLSTGVSVERAKFASILLNIAFEFEPLVVADHTKVDALMRAVRDLVEAGDGKE